MHVHACVGYDYNKIMQEPNWLVFKLQGVNRFVIHISEYLLFTCMFMLVSAMIIIKIA